MTRYLPVGAALLVVAFGVGWRARAHRRRYGSTGIVLFRGMGWRDRIPDLLIASLGSLLFAEAVVWALWPGSLAWMGVAHPHDVAGAIVLAAGLALVVQAQRDLGASWRVGIDRTVRPGLVERGLYRFSRNPIYVGVAAILVGFVLLMPTGLSLFILIGALLVIRRQVRSEEAYLAEAYGDDFRAYARRVGRFVPGMGRMSVS